MQVYRNITDTDLSQITPKCDLAGYDGLLMTELRHDPFLPLTVAATSTSRVQLAAGKLFRSRAVRWLSRTSPGI